MSDELNITSIDVSRNGIVHKNISIEKYEPPIQTASKRGRKYEAKDRQVFAPFFEQQLINNELTADPKTDRELKYDLLASPHGNSYTLRERFRKHKVSIGEFRTKFNRQELYVQQKPVILLSFTYSRNGRIIASARTDYDYLSFHQCYEKCLDFKVADPRFVEYRKIVLIRNAINNGDPEWADWTVPTDKEIQLLCTQIGVSELYNSVSFLKGYQLGD